MMFITTTRETQMATKNYCFKALNDNKHSITNLASIDRQIYFAHKYRNRLCELELKRRADSEATIRRISPEYAALAKEYDAADARVEAAYADLNSSRAKARARIQPTPEQRKEIFDAKAARREIGESLKKSRALAYAELKDLQSPHWFAADSSIPIANDMKESTRKKLVRQEFMNRTASIDLDAGSMAYERDAKLARAEAVANGVYWGTYLVVEDACKDFGIGTPPRFKKWDRNGTIGVQLAGGLSVEDAIAGKSTMLRIHLANEEELATKGRSSGERSIGIVQIRIGSNGRSPIFADVPVRFHAPLPRHGDIRFAYLHRRMIARKEQFELRLTINEPDPEHQEQQPESMVAVHLGWRIMANDSLRTAVWLGSDGQHGEIRLDNQWLNEDARLDILREERDRTFNSILPVAAEWFNKNRNRLPQELQKRSENISCWQSSDRLASLSIAWRSHRCDGDEEIFEQVNSWRRYDTRRAQQEAATRQRLIGSRECLYRTTLKKLAGTYQRIVMSKINWKDLAEKEKSDEEINQTSRQRRNARIAAPGLLSEFAKNYFAGRIVYVKADNITTTCSICGHDNRSSDKSKLFIICGKCDASWDQDENAVRVEMSRGIVAFSKINPSNGVQAIAANVAIATDDSTSKSNNNSNKQTTRKLNRNRRSSQKIK